VADRAATGRRSRPSVPELVERAREGDARSVARLISLVEDASPLLREVMARLAPHTGHAQIVGVTGAPGVGKSTSTSALVTGLRAADKRVGVLAVDPSSPFSGGALLGDRVRMQDHALDRQVYIRSMASRGHLGGLAWSTPQALRVLDAAGCDVVVIETVGVGQSEVDIAGLADTTLVLVAPGMGDGIQAAKAGILEIGDIYVVNKADRDGADQVRRDLRNMIALAERGEESWRPPIVKTVAQTGGRRRGGRAHRRPPRLAGGLRRAPPATGTAGARRDRGDRGDRPARALGRRPRPDRAGRARRAGGRRRLGPLHRGRLAAGDLHRHHGRHRHRSGVASPRASTTSRRGFATNGAEWPSEPSPRRCRTERGMRKLLSIAVIAFVLFYLFSQPQAAADAVRGAVGVVKDAFDALVTFLNALVR